MTTISVIYIFFFIGGIHQRKLLDKLFSNYDPTERPVENDMDYLNISIGIAIQQIVELVSYSLIISERH